MVGNPVEGDRRRRLGSDGEKRTKDNAWNGLPSHLWQLNLYAEDDVVGKFLLCTNAQESPTLEIHLQSVGMYLHCPSLSSAERLLAQRTQGWFDLIDPSFFRIPLT